MKSTLCIVLLCSANSLTFSHAAEQPTGALIYQDDFSEANSLWTFKLRETNGNETAINASHGKIENGVLTLKANVGCGWDYLQSMATLEKPLPNDYIIEYRARKMQWCGAFDTYIAPLEEFEVDPVNWPPVGFTLRMEGSWFGDMLVISPDSPEVVASVPPASSGQTNTEWYDYRLVKQGNTFEAFINDALQWSYSGSMLQGGFLHFWTSQAGSSGEIDDLKIYSLDEPRLEIEVASVRLKWPAIANTHYEVQWSTRLQDWTKLTNVIGAGTEIAVLDDVHDEHRFYRLVKTGDIATGLVAHYPFNGNANDQSGNANHANAVGATLAVNRFGESDRAFSFSEVNQYVATSTANGFPIGTEDFTVSLWVNAAPENLTIGDNHGILLSNFSTDEFQLGLYWNPDNKVEIQFHTGGLKFQGPPDCSSPPFDLMLDHWYNVQLTRTSNSLRMYLDGVLVGEGETSEGNDAPADKLNLQFGYRTDNSGHQLYGSLDDIRVYDRALSEVELLHLLNLRE